MQLGSVVYNSYNPNAASGGINTPPFANDGLSISGGVVQLGQDLLSAGTAAVLLGNRRIPMAGFGITFSEIGLGGSTTQPGLTFKAAVNKASTSPYLLFQDSTATETGRINFVGLETFVGFQTGQNYNGTDLRTTAMGWNTLASNVTGTRNTAFGEQALFSVTGTNASTAVGSETLKFSTGAFNNGFGYQALFNLATGTNNVAMGVFAGAGIYLGSSNNVMIGHFAGARTLIGASALNQTVIIGSLSLGSNAPGGDNMIAIGYNIFPNAEQGGTNCILIGANITATGGGIANTTMIGQGLSTNQSNIVQLGRADQNIVIGSTTFTAAATQKLNILGNMSTGGAAPLTLGAGAMDFGKIVTAASVFNAAKYWEVTVDGVLVKVCIN
jgi:hypothetical protein